MATEHPRNDIVGFYRLSFNHVVAFIYTVGTAVQLLRLIVSFSWQDMPFYADWLLVILGPYGLIGLIAFSGDIEYRGKWEQITHWLIVVHLLISVALHAWILVVHSHEIVSIFSYGYSYFAVAYFGFFAWRSWTMRFKRLNAARASDQVPPTSHGVINP